MTALRDLIEQRKVILCCGSGGVGKTTIAASIGISAALLGRRACVVTVDPARRLADALAFEHVDDRPTRVEGTFPGSLHAVMFDAKRTFDELIVRCAKDAEQAERIMSNRIYRNLASGLSGTQEYLAVEKLYELHSSGDFDCIIVDTPPTRAALDFLDAPAKLTNFVDNRIFRALIGGGSGYSRVVSMATQTALRTVSRIVGSDVVDDTVTFFQAFSGMEEDFRARAVHVHELLKDEATCYLLVTTPRLDAREEAEEFATRLRAAHHDVDALIVNRVYPDFGPPLPADAATGESSNAWHELVENLGNLSTLAAREDVLVKEIAGLAGDAPSTRVPILDTDVHDLETLYLLASYLLGYELPFGRGENPHR